MPTQTWQKLDDKISHLLEPTPEELLKAKEILGEDFPLFEKFRNGTSEEKQKARNKLIVKHRGLVYQIVNQLSFLLYLFPTDSALERDDLVQEGILGLMRAIGTYDYTKGFRFSTYAFNWISRFILRCYQDKVLPIRLPVHIHEKLRKIEKITDSLRIELGRKPNRGEIAEVMGITLEEFENTIERARVLQRILSLDAPVSESKSEKDLFLVDIVKDEGSFEEAIVKADISTKFRKKICKLFWLIGLEPRQRYFLERFFGLDGAERETLQKIADKERLSRERVRQIVEKALSKLRTPEVGKTVKTLFPELKISEPILPYPWRRALKVLKLVISRRKKREEWTSEFLLEMSASCFGLKPEQLKNPIRKNEIIEVAQSTAIFLLSKVGGLSKAQIRSFLNVKEATIETSLVKFQERLKMLGKETLLAKLQRIVQKVGDGNYRLREQWDRRRKEVLETILDHPEMTHDEIGKLLGITREMVGLRARQMEVKRGYGRWTSRRVIPRNQEILLTARLNPNLTYKKIGELFNLSEAYVSKLLRRQGFRRFKGWQGWRPSSQKIRPMDDKQRAARNQKILKMMKDNPKLSYRQIGKIFNLDKGIISKIASQAGIVHEVKAGMPKRITFEQVWQLFQKKKNLKEIAKVLNCSVETVHKRLKEGGKISRST